MLREVVSNLLTHRRCPAVPCKAVDGLTGVEVEEQHTALPSIASQANRIAEVARSRVVDLALVADLAEHAIRLQPLDRTQRTTSGQRSTRLVKEQTLPPLIHKVEALRRD